MTVKTPSISVITPVYNTEKYVAETIESVLNQTFTDFEYIIVDDQSTDGTRAIIEKFAAQDPRIKYHINEKNLGIAGNRNRGLKLATGKYVAWQDADDVSLPTRFEKQFNFMEGHPQVAICGSYLQFFDDKGDGGIRKYAADDANLRRTMFRYSPVAQPSAMIRKRCLDEMGEYDLRWPPAEDLDMSFRLGSKYQLANIPEVLVRYREHPNSATFSKLKRMELNTMGIRGKYARGHGYHMSLGDHIYNGIQFVSIFIVPPKFKIWLFNKLRNS